MKSHPLPHTKTWRQSPGPHCCCRHSKETFPSGPLPPSTPALLATNYSRRGRFCCSSSGTHPTVHRHTLIPAPPLGEELVLNCSFVLYSGGLLILLVSSWTINSCIARDKKKYHIETEDRGARTHTTLTHTHTHTHGSL